MDTTTYALAKLNEGRKQPLYLAEDCAIVQVLRADRRQGAPPEVMRPEIRVTHRPTGQIVYLPRPETPASHPGSSAEGPKEPVDIPDSAGRSSGDLVTALKATGSVGRRRQGRSHRGQCRPRATSVVQREDKPSVLRWLSKGAEALKPYAELAVELAKVAAAIRG